MWILGDAVEVDCLPYVKRVSYCRPGNASIKLSKEVNVV